MVSEALHQMGADGARRAKVWLDATTRTRSSWTNEDKVPAARMTFNWKHAGQTEFSFDVGGELYGDPFDHEFFVAEVKNYSGDDLGPHFDDFLAKCYYVAKYHPKLASQFMFMTWHPFRIKSWTKLADADTIVAACANPKNRARLLDASSEEDAIGAIEKDIVDSLSARLWIVVLSRKQEDLLISGDERALIVSHRVENGKS